MKKLFGVVMALLPFLATAQSIEGYIKDARDKAPLAGATVTLLGENKTTITDGQGYFKFSNTSGEADAEIRFVGYRTLRVTLRSETTQELLLEESATLTEEVIVQATRAGLKTPTTFSTIEKPALTRQNFGQDLPLLLNWTPSVVTTSDAGNGIGYTGINIRGSDPTRINVTLNGIPYNDSESQGVFWVDIPDIASSTQSIQIQRGVGSSTNGPGAFGATINLQTNTLNDRPYGEVIHSLGSFKTFRNTVGFGTGLMQDRWSLDGRLSKISSDGFIDRASSDLRSYYLAGGYYAGRTLIKAIVFGGKEVTYQSWYGVPESRLKSDNEAMLVTAVNEGWNEEQTQHLLNSNPRTFNIYTYENQVDDYAQDHYQLHASHRFSSSVTGNVSLHYTYGRGFYEEFRYNDRFSNYGLGPVTIGDSVITRSDLIRRRWLDNDFYGATYSLQVDREKLSLVIGGAWNRYEGRHFGEIIWAQVTEVPKNYCYYFSIADKIDFNTYAKGNYQITPALNTYLDIQVRRVTYQTAGNDNRQNMFDVDADYSFFNPKMGLTAVISSGKQLYTSLAIGNREPVRKDFVDNPIGAVPKPERLTNIELGYRQSTGTSTWSINAYWMNYRDQLVLTGALNDVGAPIRTNVDRSYRLGLELEGSFVLSPVLSWAGNITVSRNRIKEFNDVLYDYGVNFDEFNVITNSYTSTSISFSPDVITGSVFTFQPVRQVEASLLTKYVGRQFMDNTSNSNRVLAAYLTNDVRATWRFQPKHVKELAVSLLLNNLFDVEYESNGYTYGYLGGGEEFRENFYYPQAGRNLMVMINLRF